VPNAEVLPHDINGEGITRVLAAVSSQSTPGLVFVDPEGLEIQWKTLELILGRWCDLMINFQTSSIARINDAAHEAALDAFYGTPEWRNCVSGDDLLTFYVQRLSIHRDVVIPVRVQGPGVFHYHIIIAVRKTRGSQEWVDAIYRAREKIEQATSRDAEQFLDIRYKRQARLSDFESRSL
jgi:three-Cys-motif partner protein